MNRILVAGAIALPLAFSVGVVAGAAWSHSSVTPVTYPPCHDESAETGPVPCYWNATTQGNGRGTSYVILALGALGGLGLVPINATRAR